MQKLINYFFFIYYVPKIQIIYRIFFIFKRRFLQFINKNKLILKKKNFIIRKNCPIDPILNTNKEKLSLPMQVNLAGYKTFIGTNIDWFPKDLDHGTRLERLNLHYMDYLNKLNFSDAVFVINDWIEKVPPFTKYYWRDSWNCYALSIRVINWIDIISGNQDKENKYSLKIYNSIYFQVMFLINNLELDIKGNHLIKNIRCIYRACSFFSEKKTNQWIEKISYYLLNELDKQFLHDGMHFELSPSYHNLVAEDLLCIRRSFYCIEEEIKPNLRNKIKIKIDQVLIKIYKVTSRLTHPDGYPSLFSDGGLTSCKKPSLILNKIEKLEIKSFKKDFKKYDNWALIDSGYYGLRSKNNFFITKCGDLAADSLPAHGQGDSLSFEWSVDGHRIIVDQGVYTYHPSYERIISKSTRSHNTLTLNNLDQSFFWSSFKVGRRARTIVKKYEVKNDGFTLKAFHDGYRNLRGKPIVSRNMRIKSYSINFKDIVDCKFKHDVKIRILLAPLIEVKKIESKKTIKYQCLLTCLSDQKLQFLLESDRDFNIIDTLWYPNFGEKIKTKRLNFV